MERALEGSLPFIQINIITIIMNKIALLLFAAATPLLTVGAGCATSGTNNLTTTTTSATTSVDGTDELAIYAIIEPGVELIKTKTGTSTAATQSYMTALGIYGKNGARFQFVNCSGNPGTLNIKRGTKFMLDNRDNVEHKISVGATTYQIPAYSFAIIGVQKSGSYNITCDGGGAAHVGVEN